jgi:hypothetical protein
MEFRQNKNERENERTREIMRQIIKDSKERGGTEKNERDQSD